MTTPTSAFARHYFKDEILSRPNCLLTLKYLCALRCSSFPAAEIQHDMDSILHSSLPTTTPSLPTFEQQLTYFWYSSTRRKFAHRKITIYISCKKYSPWPKNISFETLHLEEGQEVPRTKGR